MRRPAVINQATGGQSPALRAVCAPRYEMRRLEQRAKGAGASDRTKYGGTRCSARTNMEHHTQRISLASVVYNAMAIRNVNLLCKKQKVAAPVAPTDDARA